MRAEEAAPPRPHRKPPSKTTVARVEQEKRIPGDRGTTILERRERAVVVDRDQPDERVYREEYDRPEDRPFAERRPAPFAPMRTYGDEPAEIGPAPFAPPWYYRERPLAWGPYSGPRVPPPVPW
jgi:hypothetical protein